MPHIPTFLFLFFFNDTATTEIYTLSLHDALPVSTTVATRRADRVLGVVLGNTWFWPATASFRLFSRVMGSRFMQRKILEENFFVERIMPQASAKRLSEEEREHYRRVQPTPEVRRGIAE